MKNVVNASEISTDDGITVLKFGATWCGPCKMLAPTLDKLAEEFSGVNFLAIDVDDAKDLGKAYNVRSVPTLVFLQDGKEVNRIIGNSLIAPIRKVLRDLTENYLKD